MDRPLRASSRGLQRPAARDGARRPRSLEHYIQIATYGTVWPQPACACWTFVTWPSPLGSSVESVLEWSQAYARLAIARPGFSGGTFSELTHDESRCAAKRYPSDKGLHKYAKMRMAVHDYQLPDEPEHAQQSDDPAPCRPLQRKPDKGKPRRCSDICAYLSQCWLRKPRPAASANSHLPVACGLVLATCGCHFAVKSFCGPRQERFQIRLQILRASHGRYPRRSHHAIRFLFGATIAGSQRHARLIYGGFHVGAGSFSVCRSHFASESSTTSPPPPLAVQITAVALTLQSNTSRQLL